MDLWTYGVYMYCKIMYFCFSLFLNVYFFWTQKFETVLPIESITMSVLSFFLWREDKCWVPSKEQLVLFFISLGLWYGTLRGRPTNWAIEVVLFFMSRGRRNIYSNLYINNVNAHRLNLLKYKHMINELQYQVLVQLF